jgi:RNase P subunit RPR2
MNEEISILPAYSDSELRSLIVKKAKEFLITAGLRIVENESKTQFSAEEFAEEDIWFDTTTFTKSDLEDMMKCIYDYNMRALNNLPSTQVILKVMCRSCKTTLMTKEQFHSNIIFETAEQSVVICNNCGELLVVNEKI